MIPCRNPCVVFNVYTVVRAPVRAGVARFARAESDPTEDLVELLKSLPEGGANPTTGTHKQVCQECDTFRV